MPALARSTHAHSSRHEPQERNGCTSSPTGVDLRCDQYALVCRSNRGVYLHCLHAHKGQPFRRSIRSMAFGPVWGRYIHWEHGWRKSRRSVVERYAGSGIGIARAGSGRFCTDRCRQNNGSPVIAVDGCYWSCNCSRSATSHHGLCPRRADDSVWPQHCRVQCRQCAGRLAWRPRFRARPWFYCTPVGRGRDHNRSLGGSFSGLVHQLGARHSIRNKNLTHGLGVVFNLWLTQIQGAKFGGNDSGPREALRMANGTEPHYCCSQPLQRPVWRAAPA